MVCMIWGLVLVWELHSAASTSASSRSPAGAVVTEVVTEVVAEDERWLRKVVSRPVYERVCGCEPEIAASVVEAKSKPKERVRTNWGSLMVLSVGGER